MRIVLMTSLALITAASASESNFLYYVPPDFEIKEQITSVHNKDVWVPMAPCKRNSPAAKRLAELVESNGRDYRISGGTFYKREVDHYAPMADDQ